MKVKKFIVNSMPDAMQQIRSELGNNAIILNTKKVKTGGWLGLFGKQQIEVIAAVDQEKSNSTNRQQSVSPQQSKGTYNGISKSFDRQQSYLQTDKPTPMSDRSIHLSDAYKDQEQVPKKQPTQDKNSLAFSDQGELLQELKQMKKVMSSLISNQDTPLPEGLKELDSLLRAQELLPELHADLLSYVLGTAPDKNDILSKEAVLMAAKEYVTKVVRRNVGRVPVTEEKQQRVQCFVGPTGVGKTTTIAKLAANIMFNEKKKVGFITSDTYRIAAVEQLKTYANIMQIPLEVVFSPDDLQDALTSLRECDVILMDTAGRNYKQQEYIAELRELLLNGRDDMQVHIVLSLTSKYPDMVAIMEQFKQIELNGLILTKMDETQSYGPIINLLHQYSTPLAFMTNGQNVPADLIHADEETIVNLLLGEHTHEGSS
ncbi:flagellar biosynthesis protein FlhF [Bacillus horti]|uniref:Flagellar biosynthesis protein FlhF n=1 Tax=Caldalkalibacillus horti TaxID=77523 RepID=A0ABT9VUM6_9BACI|nr:flagellar biosynthesis protein FlhF [Bacillus horti]MDQ0164681.1 flagellar biosynthesis protein FlhF [Bacillus horti]